MSHTSQITKDKEINIKESAKELAQLSKDKLAEQDAFLTKLFGEYEFNRYGIISMLLIAVVCLGGIAVAMGGMVNPFEIGLLVIPTLATLTFVLAVAPMRLILYTALISMSMSAIIIIYHLLV